MLGLTISDYLIFLISFPLSRIIAWTLTGFFYSNIWFSDEQDILRQKINAHIHDLNKKYYSHWILPLVLSIAIGSVPWLEWKTLDPEGCLRIVILGTMGIIGWNLTTRDIDLVSGETFYKERLLLLASILGAFFSPFFIPIYLTCALLYLRGWSHHQELGLRLLLFFTASCLGSILYFVVFGTVPSHLSEDFFMVLLIIFASHFFVPGLAKLKLGPTPMSWLLEGRLSNLIASCVMWGWRPFYFKTKFSSTYQVLRKIEIPMQAGALLLELTTALILLNVHFSYLLFISIMLFLLTVFLTTGLLFLEYMVICLLFGIAIHLFPEDAKASIFNPLNGCLGALVLSHLAFKYRLWRPKKLAWWNTPFVGIIELQLQGESGKWYRLSNDFMCPHERIFGQIYGIALLKEPRITLHTGEIKNYALAKQINKSKGDKGYLEFLKDNFGKTYYNRAKSLEYTSYLKAFITSFNLKKKKHVVPKFLKFPGEQRYYVGELPRFRGEEKIVKLKIIYKEEYFDGKEVIKLKTEVLKEYEF